MRHHSWISKASNSIIPFLIFLFFDTISFFKRVASSKGSASMGKEFCGVFIYSASLNFDQRKEELILYVVLTRGSYYMYKTLKGNPRTGLMMEKALDLIRPSARVRVYGILSLLSRMMFTYTNTHLYMISLS